MPLLLLALTVLAGSSVLALLTTRQPRLSSAVGVAGAVVAACLGLGPALAVLTGGPNPSSLSAFWPLPFAGLPGQTFVGTHFVLELDALSAFFLVPVLVLPALAAVYGGHYLLPFAPCKWLGPHWFFYNLLTVCMIVFVLARNSLLFLFAWEGMALTSFFLVTFEDEQESVRWAGWIYLASTHLATAFLVAMFVLLGRNAGGSLDFADFTRPIAPALAGLLFVLGIVGFGTKAGLVPLHVWLPEAHPAAPSHVSAVMSGVMIKMGIYGLLRLVTYLGPPAPWWGLLLMGLGLAGALLGIALALSQRDLKRALAYSSVENVGLIALGVGLGLWGLANTYPATAALGFGAALFHVWNHGLMKGLMFLGAGSVVHATGTREIEKMGGLLKRMPVTGTTLVLGAAALSALPPLNGFVGEWLLYLGLFREGITHTDAWGLIALLSIGGLAVVGGLAAICFVRLVGVALLGEPRSEAARHAHESSPWLTGPLVLLALGCVAVAVFAGPAGQLLGGPLGQLLGVTPETALASLSVMGISLSALGVCNAVLWGALALVAGGLLLLVRRNGSTEDSTWGCGYLQPTARLQYTGRSFAELIGEVLPRPLRPRVKVEVPHGLFPLPEPFQASTPDPLAEDVYLPLFRRWADYCRRAWWLQRGRVQVYLLYLLLLVVAGLTWVSLRLAGAV